MISTSIEFMSSIHADVREIKSKVIIYFEGMEPLALDDEDIVDVSILEEAQTNSRDPVGGVTSNECVLSLRNDDYRFSPANGESPLYGKLLPNVKFEVFLGLAIGEETEYILMGTFRTGDWDETTDGLEAFVTGTDKVYECSTKPIPDTPVLYGNTMKQQFINLFKLVGLNEDEYIIDDSLDQVVGIGWLPEGDFIDVSREFAIAGNCSVFADRQNRIVVKDNTNMGPVKDTFTDEDMIVQISNPQRIKDLYTGVRVNYYMPQLVSGVSLYSVSDYAVAANSTTTLTGIEFSEYPVSSVSKVIANNLNGISIRVDNIGARTADLVITNTGSAKTISLEIIGDRYQMSKLSHIEYNEEERAKWGDKVYVVDSLFIQSLVVAKEHAHNVLKIVSDPSADFKLSSRGNPALEIMDNIMLQAPTQKITDTSVTVLRSSIKYDGALSIDMECRRTLGGD